MTNDDPFASPPPVETAPRERPSRRALRLAIGGAMFTASALLIASVIFQLGVVFLVPSLASAGY